MVCCGSESCGRDLPRAASGGVLIEPVSFLVLLLMGVLAGAINAAVGSGALLTLPVLLALGMPPGTAVRTNTIGMSFSTIGSAVGYRKEIAAERSDIGRLTVVVLVCAAAGSCLLLLSPPGALEIVVPILIVVALLMVVFQPQLSKYLRRRSGSATADVADTARARSEEPGSTAPVGSSRGPYDSPGLMVSMGAASMYGGYFTAAQWILYLGILGSFTGRSMKSVNAVKNFFALIVNITAAAVYLIAHFAFGVEIRWMGVAAIAIGALLGGYFGSYLTKKLPEWVLRGVIVLVALFALVRQVT